MKKIIPILLIGMLVLSGLGAVATSIDNTKVVLEATNNEIEMSSVSPKDYTHTVLIEVGTATWCPSCPASNTAWHNIYGGGNYDFEYCEMVVDKNSVADSHMNLYSLYWLPTSYFDGGQFVNVGTNYNNFYNYLDQSGARSVPDLVADLEVEWQGNAKMEISYTVENNEGSNYPGRLRIYVIELVSRWNVYGGSSPYYHAFLDFAENKAIDIPAVGSISDTITWDGGAAGYPDITSDNIQVILAVFDDEAHTQYSDPPSGAPFNAYYVDETVAALPEGGPPPAIPDLDCDGSLSWTDVEPGASVTGTFTVENIGDPLSLLDWEIDSYPDWGTFTFDPDGGLDLTPEAGAVTVTVDVVAPDESEEEFEGEIVLVNSEDPDDICVIDVALATPVSQQSLISLFFEKLAERFPFLALVLEIIF
jgi:hypothetical protein